MKLAQHTGLLPSSSVQFSSLRYLCAQKSPYVLHPISHQPHYILHVLSCPLSQSKRMCPLPSNTDGLKVTSSPLASPPCQWGPHRTLMPASAVMPAIALVGLLCRGWWGGGGLGKDRIADLAVCTLSASRPCQWGPHRALMPTSAVIAYVALICSSCCGWWGSRQRP